jgi:hypothetical protein
MEGLALETVLAVARGLLDAEPLMTAGIVSNLRG